MMLQKVQDRIPAAAALIGAASFVGGVGYYLVNAQFDRVTLVLLGIGLALMLMAASYYPSEIVAVLRGRSLRYGSNTFAMVVFLLAILALANFYSAKHSYRWDLTDTQIHTLSQETKNVLQKVESPLKITVFTQNGSMPEMEDLLKSYQRASDKIDYQLVDPDSMPAVARDYNVKQYGTTVLEYNGKRQSITGTGEQDVTSAILKIVSGGTAKKVYFLAGHGEISIDSAEGSGGDQAKQALQADNYEATTLNLAAKGAVPDDAAVLVIAGAKTPLMDDEKKAINDYLDKGGKTFVMVDPQGSPSVSELLKARGVDVGTGIVVDPVSSLSNQPQVPVVMQYEYSQITKDMQQMTLFPLATSLTAETTMPSGLTSAPLFQSTDQSWLHSDLSSKSLSFDSSKDIKGPLTLGLSVQGSDNSTATDSNSTDKKPTMRMVVIGNSMFATNDLMRNQALGNVDLFTNSVNWLAEEESLISIRAKQPSQHEVFLTGTDSNLVFYSSAVFLPFVMLVAGVGVWWRRR